MYPNCKPMPSPGGYPENPPPIGLQPIGFCAPQPQPGYPTNPYPPQGFGQQSSYPHDPRLPQGHVPYGGAASSTPYPGALSSALYPGALSSAPYPGAPSSAPYPGAPSSAPYPGAPSSAPYPGAPSSAPYPGAPSSAPYPGAPLSAPYPGAPSSAPYPGAPSSAPYPGAPSSAPYPGAPSSAPYPGNPSSAPYPGDPSPALYPGDPSPALYPGDPSPVPYPGAPAGTGYPGAQVQHQQPQMSSPHTGTLASASNHSTKNQGVQLVPTIREAPGFDPAQDAKVLRTAMKGFATDEKALISVLCKRTNAQRLQIADMFKASDEKDLVADLKSETSGNFKDLLVALLIPRYDFLAQRVKYAVKGLGTYEAALIDVVCTVSTEELQKIQKAYERLCGRSLENDIIGNTSGNFKRILVSLCASSRSSEIHVDSALVQQDAQDLKKAGIGKIGADESVFNMILVTRSFAHLRAVFAAYEKLTEQAMECSIKKEFVGYIKNALLTIVKCIQNRPRYFAERLMASMKGLGTDDSALIFYIVSRCDVDLGTIKEEYMKLYSKPLAKDIKAWDHKILGSSEGYTSGDYRRALLALCGDE